MPFVNVRITTGATKEQKEQLVEGITDLLARVLSKNPASTHVVVEEVPPGNWGVRGETVESLRAKGVPGISPK
ncbi:MAG: tautomerase [Desulfuromonas sp.]|uniref:tautomerase family protein n=1 Tax=Desulfuromonas sp. TaxID=892 RepID=UPI000CBB085A|nr:4-oxalocrotonate tautomerase family protein [Desulfuromonas sp.]PLX82807.1 MAG: tautomerase [Desulfuromonas sp.]